MTKCTLQLPAETTFQTEGTAKALWWGWDRAWGFGGEAGKRAEAVGWSRAVCVCVCEGGRREVRWKLASVQANVGILASSLCEMGSTCSVFK